MRPVRVWIALIGSLIFSGCGYVHFGRRPAAAIGGGDAAMAEAYSNLATEHKILKHELALVRKDGDALRLALERSGSGAGVPGELAARLEETSRELASLRLNHAKLLADRVASPAPDSGGGAGGNARTEIDEKLAASLRHVTQLQEENARLRDNVARTQGENVALADQLKTAALQAERTQAALAQLNTDLLAQKEARARAEQTAEAVRSQLTAVLSHRPAAGVAPETTAMSSTSLQIAKAPPADSSPSAEFRINTEQLRAAVSSATPPKGRVHVVKIGDTLEKISRQYFNAADRWHTIYDANVTLLGNGQALQAGMELLIPEDSAAGKPQ